MTRKEFERLDIDHPEWKYLRGDLVYARYWMYFADRVRLARGEVYRRQFITIIGKTLKPVVEWINRALTRGGNA